MIIFVSMFQVSDQITYYIYMLYSFVDRADDAQAVKLYTFLIRNVFTPVRIILILLLLLFRQKASDNTERLN